MAKAGVIEIDLQANTARFQSDMRKATAALNNNTSHMKKSLSGMRSAFAGVQIAVGAMAAAFAALQSLRVLEGVARMADEYAQLQARIQNATKATGDYMAVSSQLNAIAKQTGTSLQGNVEVFQRIAIGAKDLGKSNQDVLALVKIVDQLGAVSGTSGEAMKAGLLQFGQAMSAGIVRAEEFNSIVENLPELANRIAQGMGMTTGELRKAVLEGKLLSEDVFNALLKQSGQIEKDFQAMPVSLDRASESMKTTLMELLGQIDKNIGGTKGLAQAIQTASDFFSRHREQIVQVATSMAKLIGAVGNFVMKLGELILKFDPITNGFKKILELFGKGKGPIEGATNLINGLTNAMQGLLKWVEGVGRAWERTMQKFDQGKKKMAGGKVNAFAPNQPISFGAIKEDSDAGTMADAMEEATGQAQILRGEVTNTFYQFEQMVRNWGSTFTDVVIEGFKTGKFAFKDMIASMLGDLAKLIFQLTVVQPLMNALFGNQQTGNKGIVGSLIGAIAGSIFGGGRASGGPVSGGTTYLVGEKGPELFTPGSSGAITPNHALGGGGQPIVVNIHNNYALGVQSTVRAELEAQKPRMMKDAVKAMETAIGRGGKTAQAVGRRN
jgi:tape measure domain-containing protein